MSTDGTHFRRAPRRAVGLPVRFRNVGSHLRHQGRLRDLSLGGAFVSAAVLPERGAEVHLHVQIPSCWDDVTLRARVMWRRAEGTEPGFGVRFLEPTPQEASALQALVRAASYESTGDEPP